MEEREGFKGSTIDGEVCSPAYITLTSAGVKEEMEPYPGWFSSEEVAWEFFEREKEAYLSGCRTVWWRMRPTIVEREFVDINDIGYGDYRTTSLYTVVSRLYVE